MSPCNKVEGITIMIDAGVGDVVAIIVIFDNKDTKGELNSRARPQRSWMISSITQGNMMQPRLTSH